jgi:hypothetical protein
MAEWWRESIAIAAAAPGELPQRENYSLDRGRGQVRSAVLDRFTTRIVTEGANVRSFRDQRWTPVLIGGGRGRLLRTGADAGIKDVRHLRQV